MVTATPIGPADSQPAEPAVVASSPAMRVSGHNGTPVAAACGVAAGADVVTGTSGRLVTRGAKSLVGSR